MCEREDMITITYLDAGDVSIFVHVCRRSLKQFRYITVTPVMLLEIVESLIEFTTSPS